MKKSLLLALSIVLSLSSASSYAVDGVGGGAGYDSKSEYPFVAGVNSEIPLEFFVQNLGVSTVEVSLGGETPEGITYVPVEEDVILSPGSVANYQFSVRVSEATPPGEYSLVPTIRPQVDVESEGGSTFLPGIAGPLVAKVVGASADVAIRARNFYTGTPVQGTLSLFYADTPTLPIKIAETKERVLESRVVPGNYVAKFDVAGLQTVEQEFSIAEGETKEVIIEVRGLQFTLASAQPRTDRDGNIIAAELVAIVRNDLARIEEPASLVVDVIRDGSPVQTVVMAQYPELAEGVTQQTLSYTPDGGFTGGLWEFQFKLRSTDFVLEAPEVDSFRVPTFIENNLWTILTILAFIILILLAIPRRFWWWLLAKRRKKKEEDDEKERSAVEKKD